jgi:hypothetical protein
MPENTGGKYMCVRSGFKKVDKIDPFGSRQKQKNEVVSLLRTANCNLI